MFQIFVIVLQAVTPLKVVIANAAIRLRALLDFEDENGEKRIAGDEWLFEGPGIHLLLH
jgi:major vault protein